ncbi:hypothetical protein K438DRAFT_1769764 [Mycena galopus ATCC 62051]|nr:hypothetical protein K438DRAFT_1769764 [Mycena galopus ATCC 62051]
MHFLGVRRREKVSKTNMGDWGKGHTSWREEGKKKREAKKNLARPTWAMGEKHALPTDKKERKREQGKTWVMEERHALAREEKRQEAKKKHEKAKKRSEGVKSEQEKHGQWGNITHYLDMRRQEKVSNTNMGDGNKHILPRDKKARTSEKDKYGRWGKGTHKLETRRREKGREGQKKDEKARKIEQDKYGRWGEKHTLARDKKARKSEQAKTWVMWTSMHFLETRRDKKARKSEQDKTWVMGEKHTLPIDERVRKRQRHALPRDKKARKSEKDKHGQWGKSTHFLETGRQEKVNKTNMGDGDKHALPGDEKA